MMQKLLCAILIALWSTGAADAADYPNRTIKFVVPFSAGGPTDTLARIMAERMSQSLGRPIIVENVAGAGGTLGVERVVRASADGYTISFGNWSTHVLNGAIYTLSYDLMRDLEPVAATSERASNHRRAKRYQG